MASRLRLALVGMSARLRWCFLPMLLKKEDVEIVALCDIVPGKCDMVKEANPLPDAKVFAKVEDLLANVECDAVMVATSDANHAACAVPALEAGKIVFCEKPLDVSLDACRAIVDADKKAGGKTFVGFNLRYAPVYETIKKQIEAGVVGKILTIQMDEFYSGGRTYFRRWNGLRKEGGGLWITKASHDFDLMAWLADAEPLEMSAMAEKTYYVPRTDAAMLCRDCALAEECPESVAPPQDEYNKRWWKLVEESGQRTYDGCLYNTPSDTFDHGIATVRFADDILGTYTCNVVTGVCNRRIRVSGTIGTLDGSLSDGSVTLTTRDPAEVKAVTVTDAGCDMHGGADGHVLDSFLAFARGESEPKCRPAEASLAVRMGLAATLAGDEHRTVRMQELAL